MSIIVVATLVIYFEDDCLPEVPVLLLLCYHFLLAKLILLSYYRHPLIIDEGALCFRHWTPFVFHRWLPKEFHTVENWPLLLSLGCVIGERFSEIFIAEVLSEQSRNVGKRVEVPIAGFTFYFNLWLILYFILVLPYCGFVAFWWQVGVSRSADELNHHMSSIFMVAYVHGH